MFVWKCVSRNKINVLFLLTYTTKKKKKTMYLVATALKKTCLTKQFYRHCSGIGTFLKNVNFILSVSFSVTFS